MSSRGRYGGRRVCEDRLALGVLLVMSNTSESDKIIKKMQHKASGYFRYLIKILSHDLLFPND